MIRKLLPGLSLTLLAFTAHAQVTYIENQFSGPQANSALWISEVAKVGADWTGTRGSITMRTGNAANAGYVEFINPGGIRKGYIGYGDANIIQYSAEQGAHHSFLNGNVGIGIGSTIPSNKLEINGDVALYDGNYYRIMSSSGASWANVNLIGHGFSDQDYTSIQVAGYMPNTAEIRLLSNGNVGIGTATPTSRLTVDGTVRATKVKVTQSIWPDFVFQPDYQLLSLAETEAFIKAHKHLPGMPSEASVKAEGLDMGENQAKLLQKIEELTLHLIELNKKVEIQAQLILQQSEALKAMKTNYEASSAQ